ncbi:hypothetical protein PIB30_042990 [Stylosanthes scabra]|uniref:Uncharacterized protein n=1 Tax=Stylosanthes scabra TaxID=79078 RepID=A0ABU6TEY3_9FABA|nr:hypothetical protein [Stylosanthes scabra]
MARNFDDLFNEALYDNKRRQRNKRINDLIEECLLEDDEEEQEIQHISIPPPCRFINRNRESGNDRLYKGYFAEEPVYNADIFQRSDSALFGDGLAVSAAFRTGGGY